MNTNLEWNKRFEDAIALYHKGVKGNRKASQQALMVLEQLSNENPEHVEASAYYGSATALMARDVPIPKDKKKYATLGLKMLDEAVSKAPKNHTLRILRGNVCLRLPESVFHRRSTAIEDFQYLVQRYEVDSTIMSESSYKSIVNELEKAQKRK